MKIKAIILLLIFLNIGCSPSKHFFNSGDVVINNDIEVLEIKMLRDIPFCKVSIGGSEYNFMIDTGAPLVISKEIFTKLNLKSIHSANVGDSQDKKQQQDFCIVPEIKIGNIIFKDVAAVVLTIDNQELKCFGFDGLIGSNLLAKLYWQFDYQNNKVSASKNLSNFRTDNSDFSLDFTTTAQKTPHIAGMVNDKKQEFTFDTGYGGNIKIANDLSFHQNLTAEDRFITKSGINSIGVYGNSSNEVTFVMKNKLLLDGKAFEDEIIDSGTATVIGNEFFKNYVFVMDWTNKKIHFKKNLEVEPKKVEGFGFSYLFVKGKAEVVSKVENKDILINLGDEILSINDTDFTKIQSDEICNYYMNSVEKEKNNITIKVKRGEEVLEFDLAREEFIK